jgi:hypothetical protein
MITPTLFKRLILRAVLRKVSPRPCRINLDLSGFDEVFGTVLDWDGLGFSFGIHGQEFSSFRRATRSKTLRDLELRPRETFLYTCGAIDLWEWEFRLLDLEAESDGDDTPLCLAGRRAAPPEHCSGETDAKYSPLHGTWFETNPSSDQVRLIPLEPRFHELGIAEQRFASAARVHAIKMISLD